jgi:hypothetical protein
VPGGIGLAALCEGMILAVTLAQGIRTAGATGGISQQTAACLSAVAAKLLEFTPKARTVRAGQPVALPLVKETDGALHMLLQHPSLAMAGTLTVVP